MHGNAFRSLAATAASFSAAAVFVAADPTATASSAVSSPTVIHLDLKAGQTPENIVLEPGGNADVTFAAARQVAAVTASGHVRILATLPAPADKGVKVPVLHFALTTGIVRTGDGTLYFLHASGHADTTGLYRLRPGGTPTRIAALPASGLPNGLVRDAATGKFYVTDSVLGKIFVVPAGGGLVHVWSADRALASTGFLGANGLKWHEGALWATNLDKGTVLRIPVDSDGGPGRVQVEARGLKGIDDIVFTGHGDELLAALDGPSEVVALRPGGKARVLLTKSGNGLENPTSIAIRGRTAYVGSAAYVTATDPNLTLVRLPAGL